MNLFIKLLPIFLATTLYAKEMEKDNFILLQFLILTLILIIIILYKTYAIKKLNIKLNQKIKSEIEKSREKDKMLFEQNKFISMGEVMENIAHQWRQPLSQINSSVLVIDDVLHEKNFKDSVIEEKLLEIESLTKYMSNTINDFKNFFDQDKKYETFFLNELIEKSIYIVKGTFKANNIEIENNINNRYEYLGFQNELQHVIVVLLNNAKDAFISRKIIKPKIKIDIKIISNEYHISICDNALGINDEIIDKIFNPYFTTKHKSQGTGLGLYLSKKIVEQSMQGRLEVKNTKEGACFYIILKTADKG